MKEDDNKMLYTEQELINCLEQRKKWYEKSIKIKSKLIPYENGFDFPAGNFDRWIGALYEIQNTLNMLNAKNN